MTAKYCLTDTTEKVILRMKLKTTSAKFPFVFVVDAIRTLVFVSFFFGSTLHN